MAEWHHLSESTQWDLNQIVNKLSYWMLTKNKIDKINSAIIGNIVKQMHIHIIGRSFNDSHWPNVVWGVKNNESYTIEGVDA